MSREAKSNDEQIRNAKKKSKAKIPRIIFVLLCGESTFEKLSDEIRMKLGEFGVEPFKEVLLFLYID